MNQASPSLFKRIFNTAFFSAGILMALIIILLFGTSSKTVAAEAKKPFRILLITGGCCHNYVFQAQALKEAMEKVVKRAAVDVNVVNEGGTGTQYVAPLYDDPNWAKGYDVVVHNECFADTKDPNYFRKITRAHYAGVPAVVIHCAMHTYRSATEDDWREMLGVTSKRHDRQVKFSVKIDDLKNPIVKGMPAEWNPTASDELYNIDKLWPNAKALASAVSVESKKTYPVVWTNQYGKARVFGTTLGHGDTWKDPIFTNMLSRGILWAAGDLKK
jgi:type 1 glutamine amidotransferase